MAMDLTGLLSGASSGWLNTLGKAALGAGAGYAMGGKQGALAGGLLGGASGSGALDLGDLLGGGQGGSGSLLGTGIAGIGDIYSQYQQGKQSQDLLNMQKNLINAGLLEQERQKQRQQQAEQNLSQGFGASALSNYYSA